MVKNETLLINVEDILQMRNTDVALQNPQINAHRETVRRLSK